jgi:molybdopterin-binding protein
VFGKERENNRQKASTSQTRYWLFYVITDRRHIMKYGARNQLMGTVTAIKKGSVMCEVKIKIASGAFMESVMTVNSLKELGIKKGDTVRVVVKAVNVLLVKE